MYIQVSFSLKVGFFSNLKTGCSNLVWCCPPLRKGLVYLASRTCAAVMWYYIMITTQIKFVFLCFRCFPWCTSCNYVCQNTLNKYLLMRGRGSKSVISTQSQHHNARENFVWVMCWLATKRSDWLHLILVTWHKFMMLGRPDPYFSKWAGGARLVATFTDFEASFPSSNVCHYHVWM